MSSDEIRLVSDKRTEFGKGAARKLRRADKVPAVLYGHGEAPVHLALPFHDTFQALKNPNALLTIAVEGEADQLGHGRAGGVRVAPGDDRDGVIMARSL